MKPYLALALTMGCLLDLAVLEMQSGGPPISQARQAIHENLRPSASKSNSVHYVAPTGADAGDCADPAQPCATVQYAVDQAVWGDEVHIATGVYTDMHNVPSLNTATFTATQVAVITKSVTLRGGYSVAFADPPDPDTNPTTLDAQGRGRVLYITGNVRPTIEGLRITGGDAIGLGGVSWLSQPGKKEDFGGGIYAVNASVVFRHNQVFSNTADNGGGFFLLYSSATLSENTITANTAEHNGGGLNSYCGGPGPYEHLVTLYQNIVSANTAGGSGGGLCLEYGRAALSDNTITDNVAYAAGGGLCLRYGTAGIIVISGNTVTTNTANYGGGLYLYGGISNATSTNNVIADNRAHIRGSGLSIRGTYSLHLLHTTIAHNCGGDGSGVSVTSTRWGRPSSVILTNTILVSHTVGISIAGGNSVVVDGILWHDTPITIAPAATATVTVQNQHWGDPAFLNPAAGDYHLGPGSAARDMGVDAEVYTDIDGEPRPYQLPDLGADEYWPPGALQRLYLPLAFRG